ncbi:MAG: regulatory protein RecX [Treponema sp.]|nr:regulatory protein RecX [Treponema sp.]
MRVETLEIGASGLVRLRADGGSSFLFRMEYLPESAGPVPPPGAEAKEAFLIGAAAAAGVYAAEVKALELLARAEQTRYLLTLKLRKRGMSDPTVSLALDRLEMLGLLSDERFARAWAEERSRRRGEWPARISAGLAARGVSEDLARRVCSELYSEEDRKEALLKAARRYLRSGRKDPETVSRRLRAEGWRPSEIRETLECLRKEGD